MQIEWLGMTTRHYQSGEIGRIRMVVLHATAGRKPGDLNWLRKGGDPRRPVSVHYYIDKDGHIVQFVADENIAWHAGVSRWVVDGREVNGCNAVSVGIELENLNTGRDPYPTEQYTAALWLTRRLVNKYHIPQEQLVRHLDIAPGRKTDPAGFPWERFVSEVYADRTAPLAGASAELRRHLLDLAYRSAGSALPANWPLFDTAQQLGLGMPIATLSGRPLGISPGSSQDDIDRAVYLPGQPPLAVEIYAGDLLYAELHGNGDLPSDPQIRRLSDTPTGKLRDQLLTLLFRNADPVHAYQPGWAFHRFFHEHARELGAPISVNHRIAAPDGKSYACQHFAYDSVCSPVGAWQTIYRLSEIAAAVATRRDLKGLSQAAARTLQLLMREDLYLARTGRRYGPRALFTHYADEHDLGAPLAAAEISVISGEYYALMPFARDTLYCIVPGPEWSLEQTLPPGTVVGGLRTLLHRQTTLSAASYPSSTETPLLGPRAFWPIAFDVGLHARGGERRRSTPNMLLLCPTAGPAATDLATEHDAGRWHYYVDQNGAITRLRDECYVAGATRQLTSGDSDIEQRAVVVAVEGDPHLGEVRQRTALAHLVRSLLSSMRIGPDAIHTIRRS
jgi:hypothetical protein